MGAHKTVDPPCEIFHKEDSFYWYRSTKGPFVPRVDFPVSGENVCVADKRGAGPAGLSAEQADWGIVTFGIMQSLRVRYSSPTSLYTREAFTACETKNTPGLPGVFFYSIVMLQLFT